MQGGHGELCGDRGRVDKLLKGTRGENIFSMGGSILQCYKHSLVYKEGHLSYKGETALGQLIPSTPGIAIWADETHSYGTVWPTVVEITACLQATLNLALACPYY